MLFRSDGRSRPRNSSSCEYVRKFSLNSKNKKYSSGRFFIYRERFNRNLKGLHKTHINVTFLQHSDRFGNNKKEP